MPECTLRSPSQGSGEGGADMVRRPAGVSRVSSLS